MPILRDSNLWAAEVLEDIPDFPDYRPYLTTAQNRYNWVILQEVEGILAARGLKGVNVRDIIAELMPEHLYIQPNAEVIASVSEVYQKCRTALRDYQDVKDVYIAAYAVFYDDTVVTHDYEFQRLKFYEPRLRIYTRHSAMPQGDHPLTALPDNIRQLDQYMDKLQAKEIELALIRKRH